MCVCVLCLCVCVRMQARNCRVQYAETRDRTGDLQIFSLTLSQLSYRGICFCIGYSYKWLAAWRVASHIGPTNRLH